MNIEMFVLKRVGEQNRRFSTYSIRKSWVDKY